jgi:hypothetical protein
MSIAAWNKKLEKASKLREENAIIWWRRHYFSKPEFRNQIPKWHIFADRKQDEETKYEYTWEAKCGYSYKFSEGLLLQFPQLNLSKKAPPKAERCMKCLQQEIRRIK